MAQTVVRFAPSPTGYLHIGGARTALLNYLYAKKHNGKFMIRIEDTDLQRSDTKCTDAIIDSMKWLNIQYDGNIVIQSQNLQRHLQVANDLVSKGYAYYCYCSNDRLQSLHDDQIKKGLPQKYDRCCINGSTSQLKPTIRIKVPDDIKSITINDLVKGTVTINVDTLDDMIIVRSNGTPTYLLSSVVDDHDMNITHVIRGDDHFTNTFRQFLIYKACSWNIPIFGHIPLIHGEDGTKLSKRHGAVDVCKYRNMGYLPDAVVMYLSTLGFGNNVDLNIGIDGLIKNFNIKKMSKSSSQIDLCILNKINQKLMCNMLVNNPKYLIQSLINDGFSKISEDVISKSLKDIIPRSKTLVDAANILTNVYYPDDNIKIPHLQDDIVSNINNIILNMYPDDFSSSDKITSIINKKSLELDLNIKDVLNTLRWLITRQASSPNIFNVMYVIGYQTCISRLNVNKK